MKPRQLSIQFSFFSYSGNGGGKATVPDVGYWYAETLARCAKDPRIGQLSQTDVSDTPITMTRNNAVLRARSVGADVLIMVDSDMCPDLYLGELPGVKNWFESSFDFLCKHYERGPVVIGAPYCGPPPHPTKGGMENVYVYEWVKWENDAPLTTEMANFRLEAVSQADAGRRAGIQTAGALPTGLIMFDMRAFELTEPVDGAPEKRGWFYYEWTDKYAATKGSTEDITATRDISLAGAKALGYNPVFCNWDAWAGHYKTKCVGKPFLVPAEQIADVFADGVRNNWDSRTRNIQVRTKLGDELKAQPAIYVPPGAINPTKLAEAVAADALSAGACRIEPLRATANGPRDLEYSLSALTEGNGAAR